MIARFQCRHTHAIIDLSPGHYLHNCNPAYMTMVGMKGRDGWPKGEGGNNYSGSYLPWEWKEGREGGSN